MNELLIYKVAFDNIARTIKQWNNDEEAVQADFEYLMDIENTINAVGRLPDNATNGDVMKMLFGCGELSCDCDTDYESVIAYGLDTTPTCKGTLFTAKWWKSPYKGGQKDGNDN